MATMASADINVFVELLAHNELAYELSRHLDVEEFATLYSVSQRFHRLVNAKLTTCLERNAATNAPESAAVFPWRMYRDLCIYDPMRNLLDKLDSKTGKARVRDTPSLRWLRMVMHREETVASIIVELAEAGHRLPRGSSLMLKKLWFLMDYPDTKRRIGIIHNKKIWSDRELLLATLFFIKLDMRFTDPMDGGARLHLRHMMVAQRGLSPLALVLERRTMTTMYDFMRMFVELRMKMTGSVPAETIFGLPAELGGCLMQEGWTNEGPNSYLLPVDDLVLKEGIRRNLRLNRWYLDMMLWGYVDSVTAENIWPPSIEIEKMKSAANPDETDHQAEGAEEAMQQDEDINDCRLSGTDRGANDTHRMEDADNDDSPRQHEDVWRSSVFDSVATNGRETGTSTLGEDAMDVD